MRCNGLVSGDTRVCVDEETMVCWFANALMRGYDEHRWKAERAAAHGGKSEQAAERMGTVPPGFGYGEASSLARPVTQADMEQYVAKALTESREELDDLRKQAGFTRELCSGHMTTTNAWAGQFDERLKALEATK